MVNTGLQPCDLRKVNVVAGSRLGFIERLSDPAPAVLIDGLAALRPLELLLHRILDSRSSHDVIHIVVWTVLFQFLQLVFLHLAGIADNRGKCDTVVIGPDGGFLHVDACKIRGMLQHIRDSLIRYLCRYRRRLVFTERHETECVFDIDDVQRLLIRHGDRIAVGILHLI